MVSCHALLKWCLNIALGLYEIANGCSLIESKPTFPGHVLYLYPGLISANETHIYITLTHMIWDNTQKTVPDIIPIPHPHRQIIKSLCEYFWEKLSCYKEFPLIMGTLYNMIIFTMLVFPLGLQKPLIWFMAVLEASPAWTPKWPPNYSSRLHNGGPCQGQ